MNPTTPNRTFQVDTESFGPGRTLLAVHGELDLATAPSLREHLDAVIDAGAERVVLDLAEVTFFDSVALATMVHARRRLGDRGRLAVVVVPDSYPTLILRASGTVAIFDCFPDRLEAIAALRD